MSTDPMNDGLSNFSAKGSSHSPRHGKPIVKPTIRPEVIDRVSQAEPKNTRRHLLEFSRSFISGAPVEEILYRAIQGIFRSIPQVTCSIFVRESENRLYAALAAVQARFGHGKVKVDRLKDSPNLKANGSGRNHPGVINRTDYESPQAVNPGDSSIVMTMIVPLGIGTRSLGEFRLLRKSGPAFSEEESELAQLFINPAILAVENDTLQAEARVQKQLFTRLTPFAGSLNRPFRASEITETIGKGALALSGSDRAAVYGQNQPDQDCHVWSQGLSTSGISKILEITGDGPDSTRGCLFASTLADLPAGSSWRKIAEMEGIAALAVCPIVFENQKMAQLGCFFDRPHAWSQAEIEALELYSRHAAVALENTRLYEELEESYLQTVLTMARMLDARDSYTARHSRRLTAWAEGTARRLNCSPEEIKLIRWAAMLHDIGKIGIPDSILLKAGPLTEDEWAVMKRHPELGAEIVAPVKKLSKVTPIIRAHQEKFDGSGYPDGLAGEQIPLAARILTVVDAFGAMTDDRVFRKARTQEEAVDELKRCSGKHFDQKVVQVFFEVIDAVPLVS